MIRDLYLIEFVDYAYYDKVDNEVVENRSFVGYFFDEKRKDKVIEMCNKLKGKREEVIVTKYAFECSPNQKYVYELSYGYSVIRFGEYEDYYQWFDPMSSREKCLEKKEELLKDSKYQKKDYKIYDDETDSEGFCIDKAKINSIYHFTRDEIHKYIGE